MTKRIITVKEGLYTEDEKQAIMERARNTEYKHPRFFKEGGRTVEYAMGYYAKTGDFYLDIAGGDLRNIEGFIWDMQELDISINSLNIKDVINYCINTRQWKPLVIRYAGKERGTDRGKLKIETYLILKGIV